MGRESCAARAGGGWCLVVLFSTLTLGCSGPSRPDEPPPAATPEPPAATPEPPAAPPPAAPPAEPLGGLPKATAAVPVADYHDLARFCSNPYYLDRRPSRPTRAQDLTADLVRLGERLGRHELAAVRDPAREELATLGAQYGLWRLRAGGPTQGEGIDLFVKTFVGNAGKKVEDGDWGEFLGTTLKWNAQFQLQDALEKAVAGRREKTWERVRGLAPVCGGPAAAAPLAKVWVLYERPGFGFTCSLWAENVSGRELTNCSLFSHCRVLDRVTGQDFEFPGFHFVPRWRPGERVQLDVGPFYNTPQLALVYRTRHTLWADGATESERVSQQDEAITRLAGEQFERAGYAVRVKNYVAMETEFRPLDRMAPLPPAVADRLGATRKAVGAEAAKQLAELEAVRACLDPKKAYRMRVPARPKMPEVTVKLARADDTTSDALVELTDPPFEARTTPIVLKGTAKAELALKHDGKEWVARPSVIFALRTFSIRLFPEGDRFEGEDSASQKWVMRPE